MKFFHELVHYFSLLSDIADEIRKLDRDKYKHNSDMEILELVLIEKVDNLKNGRF